MLTFDRAVRTEPDEPQDRPYECKFHERNRQSEHQNLEQNWMLLLEVT